MAFIKVTDVDNLFKSYGYERKWYDSFDGWIRCINYMKEGDKEPIKLFFGYDNDYLEELCLMEEEFKIRSEIRFSRCYATVICIPAQLATDARFLNGAKYGIVLSIPSLDKDEKHYFHDLTIENIRRFLWFYEHKCPVAKAHVEYTQDIRNFLEKFKQCNHICKFNKPIFGSSEKFENYKIPSLEKFLNYIHELCKKGFMRLIYAIVAFANLFILLAYGVQFEAVLLTLACSFVAFCAGICDGDAQK